ncbi:hypothetical protein C4D60_Mb04t04330 [Musa balbisiana]|uniref:MLO-like protein n=1 Tax=Musa balbisiana TaxID=52838 RepID=A0A4S8K9L2_MUSBA|nr:hypothetical protein C4D60_Mb04t04330 [Musa balbisiana]
MTCDGITSKKLLQLAYSRVAGTKSGSMAGGGAGGRTLEQTSTWAVATVCFALVIISVAIEHGIHLITKWLEKHHKRALQEALEKIKSELMLLGFVSLLLTVGQSAISEICVPKSVGDSWHPCKMEVHDDSSTDHSRRLSGRSGPDKTRFPSSLLTDSINSTYSSSSWPSLMLSTASRPWLWMRHWKSWELETKTAEYEFSHDPDRFRFARETSFGRRHLSFWSKSPVLIWIACFFRQFVISLPKVDYLTLRNGFIIAHLAPQSSSKFDFRKYIKRSLDEDFKVVVGISPALWFFAVLFLLFNTHGWHSYLWLPFVPLIIILLVGTKLQVIIIRMAQRIMERGDVIKGVPVVHPTDDLFWFRRPRLMLYLIHFVLFQNAFQLAFLAWSWYEFGFPSCFHKRVEDIIVRLSMGLLIQVLCSYVTLPLYALVTQMGSKMKPTIFNERVATALRKWHQTARKNLRENRKSGSITPLSTSRPTTPKNSFAQIYRLQHLPSDLESQPDSSRNYNFDRDHLEIEESFSSTSRPTTATGRSSPAYLLRHLPSDLSTQQESPNRYNLCKGRYDMEGPSLPSERTVDIELQGAALEGGEAQSKSYSPQSPAL